MAFRRPSIRSRSAPRKEKWSRRFPRPFFRGRSPGIGISDFVRRQGGDNPVLTAPENRFRRRVGLDRRGDRLVPRAAATACDVTPMWIFQRGVKPRMACAQTSGTPGDRRAVRGTGSCLPLLASGDPSAHPGPRVQLEAPIRGLPTLSGGGHLPDARQRVDARLGGLEDVLFCEEFVNTLLGRERRDMESCLHAAGCAPAARIQTPGAGTARGTPAGARTRAAATGAPVRKRK